jgi:hypothetical protein
MLTFSRKSIRPWRLSFVVAGGANDDPARPEEPWALFAASHKGVVRQELLFILFTVFTHHIEGDDVEDQGNDKEQQAKGKGG